MMKNIKLTAFDMDGTLLNDRKELPPDFPAWVTNHPQIRKVIASGRQYYTLRDNMGELKDEFLYVAENGGVVYEKEEALYCDKISSEDLRYCVDRLNRMEGVTPMLCGVKGAYIRQDTKAAVFKEASMYYHRLTKCENVMEEALKDRIVKIAIFVENYQVDKAAAAFADLPERLAVVVSGDSWIDIANASANKGAGIAAIQRKYQIKPEECMAFGDYLNDVELLKSCGESYCMENGHPRLKEIARYIAPSNNECGVMQVINQLPFNV